VGTQIPVAAAERTAVMNGRLGPVPMPSSVIASPCFSASRSNRPRFSETVSSL
jgi:hypothetical protein